MSTRKGMQVWWALGAMWPVAMGMVAASAWAEPAAAPQVFKCVDGGHVAYQSAPCPGRTAGTWDARPEPPPSWAQRQYLRRLEQENRARNATWRRGRAFHARGRAHASRGQRDACQLARAQREAAYREAGLKRDFALSSRWDNRVHDACK